MWRTLFVAALLVLAGCATEAPDTETDTTPSAEANVAPGSGADASPDDGANASPDAPPNTTADAEADAPSDTEENDGDSTDRRNEADRRALTPTETPATTQTRPNPWGERELTVGIDDAANESRNFRPLVAEALDFWSTNSARFAGYPIEYELDPDADDPDLIVEFVDTIESCANVSDPAGCAPYVTHRGQVSRPITVEVAGSYSNESTVLILKHELGHTLGLNHSAGPQSVMAPSSQLTTLPRPNATERLLPWTDANFTVYLDASGVEASDSAGDTDDADDGGSTDDTDATAETDATDETERVDAVREQVRHALDYYGAGANGTVPANVSYEFTDNRSAADVIVALADELPCRTGTTGSCGRVRGVDPDGDGALERYDSLRVTLSGIDTPAVGWHVGYWLGYGFGFEGDSEWPAPFRSAGYDERRSEWWTTEE